MFNITQTHTHTQREIEKYSRAGVCREAIPKFGQPLATLSAGRSVWRTTVHKMQTVQFKRQNGCHAKRQRRESRANAQTERKNLKK